MVSDVTNHTRKGLSLVSNILLQICEKFISEVAGIFGEGKVTTIDEIETSLKEKTNSFIL